MIRGSLGPRGRAIRGGAAGAAIVPAESTPEAGSSGAGAAAVAGTAGGAIVPAESRPEAGSFGAGAPAAAGTAGGVLRASLAGA